MIISSNHLNRFTNWIFVGIDPSTKTGFGALDQGGIVLKEKELKGVSSQDQKRMVTLIDEILTQVRPEDIICIEGFPFDTQRAMFAGGIHWGIQNELFKRGISYYEAAPNAVKKFVNVKSSVGESGSKVRLKGPEKKKAVMKVVENILLIFKKVTTWWMPISWLK